jgi:hypothetical protein
MMTHISFHFLKGEGCFVSLGPIDYVAYTQDTKKCGTSRRQVILSEVPEFELTHFRFTFTLTSLFKKKSTSWRKYESTSPWGLNPIQRGLPTG